MRSGFCAVHFTLGVWLASWASTLPFCEEARMEDITGDMKVAEVIRRHPEVVEMFLARGCPDMRRAAPRTMTASCSRS